MLMVYQVFANLKDGISYPLRLKLEADPRRRHHPIYQNRRTGPQVFSYIFGQPHFSLNCLIPLNFTRPTDLNSLPALLQATFSILSTSSTTGGDKMERRIDKYLDKLSKEYL